MVFSKNTFSENTKHIKTSNRLWKKWNTGIFAPKGLFYHILKYGRFLLEHPLYKFSLNEFWPSKFICVQPETWAPHICRQALAPQRPRLPLQRHLQMPASVLWAAAPATRLLPTERPPAHLTHACGARATLLPSAAQPPRLKPLRTGLYRAQDLLVTKIFKNDL